MSKKNKKKTVNDYPYHDYDDISVWNIIKQKELRLSEIFMVVGVVFVIVAMKFIPDPISSYAVVGGSIITIIFTRMFIDRFNTEFSLYLSKRR